MITTTKIKINNNKMLIKMKHYINKFIVITILLFSFFQLHAQTSALNFTLNSDKVKISGHSTEIESTIKKIENNLVWTQYVNGKTKIIKFTITDNTENWDRETSLGSIFYTMPLEGHTCNLKLIGLESEITATLTIRISNRQEEHYIFNISSINYQ